MNKEAVKSVSSDKKRRNCVNVYCCSFGVKIQLLFMLHLFRLPTEFVVFLEALDYMRVICICLITTFCYIT